MSDFDQKKVIGLVNKYKSKTDFLAVCAEKRQGTYISLRQKKVETVSKPNSYGGSIRVLIKGGWGFVSFNDPNTLEDSIIKAINYAKYVGQGKSYFTESKSIVDRVILDRPNRDFLKVSLDDKVRLLKKYDHVAWQSSKYIANVNIIYTDSLVGKLLVTSDGSVIFQEKPYVYSIIYYTSKYQNTIQRYVQRLTDTNYQTLIGQDKVVNEGGKIAAKIAQAASVKSGKYTVIINPRLAGTFIHEAFGHLSESDNIDENKQLAKLMKIGRVFGSKQLSIIDNPTLSNLRGSYQYDDEGVPAKKAILLDHGKLVGRLHSRETAARLKEATNGHARAASALDTPLIRMGVTIIEPGKYSFKEMIKGVNKGLYCVDWIAGMTDHELFTFTAGYAIEIINGRLANMLRDVKLTGNLFETLKNVDMVGNDIEIDGGTCGKGNQHLPISDGGPHLRIQNMTVIGG